MRGWTIQSKRVGLRGSEEGARREAGWGTRLAHAWGGSTRPFGKIWVAIVTPAG